MKWSVVLVVFFVLEFGGAYSFAGNDWNAGEHDYHLSVCKRFRQSSSPGDTSRCGSYEGRTGYGCCCDTCSDYYAECTRIMKLTHDRCEKIKTSCENDCNSFLAKQSPDS